MKSVDLDLGQSGFPDQWVKIIDPRYLTQRKFEELMKSTDGEQFLRDRIEAWHVLDGDTGEPLGEPQTADLKGLPIGVISVITDKIGELFEATIPFRSRKA